MFNVNSVEVSSGAGLSGKGSGNSKTPWQPILIGALLTFYVYLYSSNLSSLFVFYSVLLILISTVFCVFHRPDEALNPVKIFSVLYCASFAFLPFWIESVGGYNFRYLKSVVPELMDKGSGMALLGYVSFLTGYFLFKINYEKYRSEVSFVDELSGYSLFCAAILLIVGFVCFSVILIQLGGIQHFTKFNEGRAELLAGVYGGFFWGMHLLISGLSIVCVMYIKRFPILCLLLALVISACFSILQGRDMVVAPLFCWLILYDSLRNRIRFRAIIGFFFVLIVISSLVGAIRGGGMVGDIGEFFAAFIEKATFHFAKLLAANIEQFDTAMVAIKHADSDGRVGFMVLMTWFEPLDRALFGNSINSINSGILIDLLIMPEHKGWSTAASPSIIGELYLAFKWLGVAFGMLVIGVFYALLVAWLDRKQKSYLLFAAYPFVLYVTTKMIVDGFQHGFRGILIFVSIAIFNLFRNQSNRVNE